MALPESANAAAVQDWVPGRPLRVAVLGEGHWLDGCAPAPSARLAPRCFRARGDAADTTGELARFAPAVSVVFDPLALEPALLDSLPGVTLGVLVGSELPEPAQAAALRAFDRVASFRPALTGEPLGGEAPGGEAPGGESSGDDAPGGESAGGEAAGMQAIWRALPPPVSDAYFGEVRALHSSALVMSVGRSTPHREAMLMPAKHHHDLLQVLHGVSGETLAGLLREYDVGVYVAPDNGGGFGMQVGMHLAAGQLLLSEQLVPSHGLEREIDYLHISSPEGLTYMLERLARFPEMHQRVRVRGRMKAEQFRASRWFARVAHDLLADVRAFGRGSSRPPHPG